MALPERLENAGATPPKQKGRPSRCWRRSGGKSSHLILGINCQKSCARVLPEVFWTPRDPSTSETGQRVQETLFAAARGPQSHQPEDPRLRDWRSHGGRTQWNRSSRPFQRGAKHCVSSFPRQRWCSYHQNTPLCTGWLYWILMFTTSNVNRSGGSALTGFGVMPAHVRYAVLPTCEFRYSRN